jgi:hypothetical protein
MKNVYSILGFLLISSMSFDQTANVTINVNMSNEIVSEQGVFLAGGNDFGNPGDNPMLDEDGDGTYSITVELNVPYTGNYTFTNGACGDYSCKENIEGQDCADGTWNDRLLDNITEDTTISTCFSECSTDGTCTTEYAIDVTFEVNMSNEEVDPSGVYVAGGTDFGFPGDHQMLDENGDGTYSITLSVNAPNGGSYTGNYTFLNGNCGNWSCKEDIEGLSCADGPYSDRVLTALTENTTVSTCFGQCSTDGTCAAVEEPEQVMVTWQVDMSVAGANPAGIFMAGGFQGWNPGATQLSDDDGDGIYTYSQLATPGDFYDWKFLNGPAWGDDEAVPGACASEFGNRFITIPETDTVIDADCFASCVSCDTVVDQYMVTFMVNMENEDVAESGVYLAGGGNFGNPGDNPMLDDNGDGVYTISMMLDEGFSSHYTFTNGACGDYSCKENIAGQQCADENNYNDRFLPSIEGPTTINTCFSQCTTDGSCAPAEEATVTFRVDMSTSGVTGAVSVFGGSVNGWSFPGEQMTDDDGDNVYEYTMVLSSGGHEFKYVNSGVEESLDPALTECTLTSGDFTNRYITVEAGVDMVLQAVCFEACSACEINDGEVYGCMDSAASNFNEEANVDDGSCLFSTTFNVDMSCSGIEYTNVYVTGPWCGWCGGEDYNLMSDDDGDGIYSVTLELTGAIEYKYMVDGWAHQEDLVDDMQNGGDCATVTDYSSYANRLTESGSETNDSYGTCGSCVVAGCMDPFFAEFDMYATEDDGSCMTPVVFGCVYDSAENYSSDANTDDGSCEFAEDACPGDLDGDGLVATPDLLAFLAVFGTECE